jgi:hypothetical protein
MRLFGQTIVRGEVCRPLCAKGNLPWQTTELLGQVGAERHSVVQLQQPRGIALDNVTCKILFLVLNEFEVR